MLQQYGFDDDDDGDDDDGGGGGDDGGGGGEEEGCGDDDGYCDKKVKDDNNDDGICKNDEEGESRVKIVIVDLLCSSINDYFDLDIFDLQLVNISICLDKIMVVLIRVRLKMEKFIDLSIL